ncbi:MAG TPA: acyl-CoA thioesterase II [Deltaproteobacteria bacterium]|nr:acyl-CoA thioesterase II [Deltaproteobacteria bacterium]
MTAALQSLLDLLDLEEIELNLFRGRSPQERSQRVFGGQVVGQALVAAYRTVEDRHVHSLKGDFLRPGDPKIPILYEVDRIRDGRSFTTRRVVAIQHGRAIFSMSVSFQIEESGLEHQASMPDVPGPTETPDPHMYDEKLRAHLPPERRDWLDRVPPIESRPVRPIDPIDPEKRPPELAVWLRAAGGMPDDDRLHQCVLAYASDMHLLDTCLLPHGISWLSPNFQSASLDHSIWFHRRFRADEWLLFVQDSPSASGARGFNRGLVFTEDGRLIASVVQEGLIRLRGSDPSGGAA